MTEIAEGHGISVGLLQPEIAPNTGNIGRLCVATGASLEIVRPMGFILGDKQLRRSGMDYWERLKLTVHDDDAGFLSAMSGRRMWGLSSKAEMDLWDAEFEAGDVLVFENESRGMTVGFRSAFPGKLLRISQAKGERCLNVSTAAGVALYEALRQVSRRA